MSEPYKGLPVVMQEHNPEPEQTLAELSEWLEGQIDGGCECQGRDSAITRYIEAVEVAVATIGMLLGEKYNLTAELAALREQVATQKDWVLVPREPTEKMIDAGESLNHASYNSQPTKEIYRAMIAAISKGETK